MQVAGEEQPLEETGALRVPEFELPAARNNLLIEYVALSLQGEQKLRYQYKLEGVDADWSSPGEERSVNYARLAPGAYQFLARAINQEGTPSLEPAGLRFRILPPLWQRWWVLTLAVITLGLAGYSFYRYRVAQLIKLERIRIRIATDLHDDIGSNLSLIVMVSEAAHGRALPEDRRMAEWLSLISDTSREMVDAMSDIVWAVNPNKDWLRDLIARMRRVADDIFTARQIAFRFSVSGQEKDVKLGADTRREVFMIFKESINNIARHSQCTKAEIEFQEEENWLRLKLSDNGKGFDLAAVSDGNGMVSMRRRAQKLGGELEVISNLGEGTTVILKAPLGGRRR